ncbi:outer membrane beta-barrel protein [Chitinophagaceae bacterium 26-R-25]|nr:outer membrane beta-barrel protein [Chitinophagaceae bacterium 26-R-25]
MNRFILLFCLLLFFSTTSYSQSEWWVGGAGSYSSYKNTGPINPIYFRGETDAIQFHANQWNIGFSAERKITKNLFVQSGVQWTYFSLVARTWDQSSSGSSPNFFILTANNAQEVAYEATNQFYISRNYITIPALLRFSMYQARHFGLYLKGGVNTSFAVSASKAAIENRDITIQDDLKGNYFHNSNIYVEGNSLLGISFGNPEKSMSHFEGGLTIPITSHAGTNKLGVGYKLSYIFLIHL